MNLAHVHLFVRIAYLQNISQAGLELNLSAAVASLHLSKLESFLGVRLINRTTRKISLTQEGLAFLPHAEDLLSSVEAAKASVGSEHETLIGTLRIAAPASFGRMHLLPVLEKFMDQYQQIKIDLQLSDRIVDLVEGGFDVAIRNSALKDSSLIARKIVNDRRVLCASPEFIRQYGQPKTPEELHNFNCLTLIDMEHWSFDIGNQTTKIKVKGNFRTDNGEAIRDACVRGLGLTINSTWSAYQSLVSGELIEVMPTYPVSSNTAIWAVYPSSRLLAPKVRAFIDHIVKYFEGEPYWDKALAN